MAITALTPTARITRYIGLSTDTKPTAASHPNQPSPVVGSTFWEYDTDQLWVTYDATNWSRKDTIFKGVLKKVSVTKALVGGAYSAEDILSESTTEGTFWTFSAIARADGASGYIVRAQAICETTNITPRLTLFLFNATPTCAKNDNVANTALLHADLANYVGRIDFPALEDLGGDSMALCTPGTTGNLPLAFTCASGADDLYGVLVTRDAVTPSAGDDMTIILQIEQY